MESGGRVGENGADTGDHCDGGMDDHCDGGMGEYCNGGMSDHCNNDMDGHYNHNMDDQCNNDMSGHCDGSITSTEYDLFEMDGRSRRIITNSNHIIQPIIRITQPTTHIRIEIESARDVGEKITCAEKSQQLFGGFMGGVYRIERKTDQLIKRYRDPVSYLRYAGEREQKLENEAREHTHIAGLWSGEAVENGKLLKVSAYPIKYVLNIENTSSMKRQLLVADSSSLFLCENGEVLGSIHLGTYPLAITRKGGHFACVTGYTVHWVKLENRAIREVGRAEIQKKTGNKETITCIAEEDGYVCGTVGGWIMKVSGVESAETFEAAMVAKVSEKKIKDVEIVEIEKKKYFLCIDPNRVYLIDEKTKKQVSEKKLTENSGLHSIVPLKHPDEVVFAILDVNCKVHVIRLNTQSSKERTEPPECVEDTYRKLLEEIDLGTL